MNNNQSCLPRKTVLSRKTVALLVLILGMTCQLSFANAPWKAGVASVNITPQQFMWMAGYGSRSHPADGKLRDLWAKSLVLEDARGHRGVLISLDLVGIDRTLASALHDQLEKRFELHREQIAICVTHTHTGPVVGRCLAPLHYLQLDQAQQRLVDEYAQQLQHKIVECVGRAIADIGPCNLTYGSGRAQFAVNRRNNSESKVPDLRKANKLVGPVDHDVPVLAVRTLHGQLKTIVFGYACHATVLSDYKWSGDYPGFAQMELESSFPGSVAMFWAGCGADQNPLPRRKVELARQYGRRLAQAVTNALDAEMNPLSGSLTTQLREVSLLLDRLPSAAQLIDEAESNNRYIHACRQMQMATRPLGDPEAVKLPRPVNRFLRARAEMLLQKISAGRPLAATYPYPIGVWSLGEQIQFVFLGGEVVVDYAIRLKSELRGSDTWVAGYANDVMAYIPSERVLREGGYEGSGAMVYYGLPTAWKTGVESMIVDTVHALAETVSVTAQ